MCETIHRQMDVLRWEKKWKLFCATHLSLVPRAPNTNLQAVAALLQCPSGASMEKTNFSYLTLLSFPLVTAQSSWPQMMVGKLIALPSGSATSSPQHLVQRAHYCWCQENLLLNLMLHVAVTCQHKLKLLRDNDYIMLKYYIAYCVLLTVVI